MNINGGTGGICVVFAGTVVSARVVCVYENAHIHAHVSISAR